MLSRTLVGLLLLWGMGTSVRGQGTQFRRVDPENTHERMVAIVPVTGAGTRTNPGRAMFTDLPGIIGYKVEFSDDRRFALVELVARDRKVFDAIRVSQLAGLRFAQKDDVVQKEGVLQQFVALKRGFQPGMFRGLPVK